MLVKSEKGRIIEVQLVRMAQSGQLGGKLSEDKLICLLEHFTPQKALFSLFSEYADGTQAWKRPNHRDSACPDSPVAAVWKDTEQI